MPSHFTTLLTWTANNDMQINTKERTLSGRKIAIKLIDWLISCRLLGVPLHPLRMHSCFWDFSAAGWLDALELYPGQSAGSDCYDRQLQTATFIMRPSSLGGGRIFRRTLSVRLSFCPSVPLSLPSVTSRHLANYNDTYVLFGTHWGHPYFSAPTEGRISYGHLGRTNSCFIITIMRSTIAHFIYSLSREIYPNDIYYIEKTAQSIYICINRCSKTAKIKLFKFIL